MKRIHYRPFTTREEYAAIVLFFNSIVSLAISYFATRFTNSITIENDMLSYVIDIVYYASITCLIFKIKKENEYNFNYCTGKIEASISFLTGMLLLGYIIYVAIIVYKQYLELVPFNSSYMVFLLYLIMMIKNIAVLIIIKMLIGNEKSSIIESGNTYAISCVIDNIIALIPFISYVLFLKNNGAAIVYVDIVCSIILGLSNLYLIFPMLKKSTNQLLDRALEEEVLLQILKVLAKHYDLYNHLVSLKSRETGGIKYIEIFMEFDDNLNLSVVLDYMNQIKTSLEEEIINSVIIVIPAKMEIKKYEKGQVFR